MSLTEFSASQLSVAIHDRRVSCVEVMNAYLARIREFNPVYNAVVSMRDEDTLKVEANEADQALQNGQYRGWMHGMPHAVKDLANVEGLETTMGSPLLAGTIAEQDDVHIARIRACGAIIIGKTNVPEFGLGSHTFNPVFGPTRCGINPELCAGGSSGGAASALATQMLPVADGSDMMGSLRNPAAFNNVVGFRPSMGRVPRTAAKGMFDSDLVTAGPMGRTVEDTIRLLHTISGFDANDPISLQDPLPSPQAFVPCSLKGLRIGWLGDFNGYLAMEPGIQAMCKHALAQLAIEGAHVEQCHPDFDMARLWRAWLVLRHQAMAGMREHLDTREDRDRLRAEVIWEIQEGLALTHQDIAFAELVRAEWNEALSAMYKHYDLLALPAAQVFPFDVSIDWPKSIAERSMDTYHRWMEVSIGGSMAGQPVVSLPAGFDAGNRPMGIQFMGAINADKKVLEFALAYEACTGFIA